MVVERVCYDGALVDGRPLAVWQGEYEIQVACLVDTRPDQYYMRAVEPNYLVPDPPAHFVGLTVDEGVRLYWFAVPR